MHTHLSHTHACMHTHTHTHTHTFTHTHTDKHTHTHTLSHAHTQSKSNRTFCFLCADFIQQVATQTAIMLDPVYSGKAALAMVQEMQNNTAAFKGRRVLFLHTGTTTTEYNIFVLNSAFLPTCGITTRQGSNVLWVLAAFCISRFPPLCSLLL